MPCPLCQQENPTSQNFCGECGTSLAGPHMGAGFDGYQSKPINVTEFVAAGVQLLA